MLHQMQQLFDWFRKVIECECGKSINVCHKPQNDRYKWLNLMAQHQANKRTTLDSGVPVWVFSLIYSCTTPSLSARFSDIPHATASSLCPRTRMTCQWDCGPAPGDEEAAKGHSGSHLHLRGSHEGVKDNQPAPLLHRATLPAEGLHERSCPRGRWCWNQNQAPGWRARRFLAHQGEY